MKLPLYVAFFSFLTIISCNNNEIPAGAYSFKNHIWSVDNVVKFEFDLEDTVGIYDYVLILRNTTDYLYSNLYVNIEEFPPYGENIKTRHEIPIANPDGSWIGVKSGSIIENKYLIKRSSAPFIGNYKFEIQHAITDENVEELLDLTMVIVKSNGQ